jgi:hypothetical protein
VFTESLPSNWYTHHNIIQTQDSSGTQVTPSVQNLKGIFEEKIREKNSVYAT